MAEADPDLVSVVVPAYNSVKTIALCIESVLAQTYRAIELIVVDDASTDATAEIAGRYGGRLVRLPSNGGAGLARNRGIEAARGGILFFLDSDVGLAPDAVANAVRVFRANPDCAAVWGVYGDRPLVDDGVVERVQILYGHFRQVQPQPVVTGHFAVGALRRSVIDAIGGFDERLVGQFTNEDHEFGLRIARQFPVQRALDVVGYHDDEEQVWSVLRKCYLRAVSLTPLVFRQRDLRPEREAVHRPAKLLAVLLSAVTVPLVLLDGWLAVVPAAGFAWFIGTEFRVLAFVRRTAGWPLVPATVVLSYVYGLAVAAGALSGAARYLVDREFRRRYRPATAG